MRFRQVTILALSSAMLWAVPADPTGVAEKVDVPAIYQLQTNDEIVVRSLGIKELADKTFRLDDKGEVNLPLIGRTALLGKTGAEAEEIVATKLKKFYLDPDIQITITPLHTEPFSAIGAVGSPGIHQLKPGMTLLDGLSAAGGLRADAGPVVIITREANYGAISQPGARTSMNGQSTVELDLKGLLASANPAANMVLKPHDVISIPGAQVIYVIGNVKKAGGFTLSGRPDMSVLQALALAEGLDPRAAPERARILRRNTNGETLVPVDLKKVLAGKTEDLQLHPNDILFVPNSTMKVVTSRTIDTAIGVATGLLIWR